MKLSSFFSWVVFKNSEKIFYSSVQLNYAVILNLLISISAANQVPLTHFLIVYARTAIMEDTVNTIKGRQVL